MILLFAPTKTFKVGITAPQSTLNFPDKTNHLIQEIKHWDLAEIKRRFAVSDKVAKEVLSIYQHYEEITCCHAFSMFYGPAFQAFDFQSLDQEGLAYLEGHVFILDALYGVIRPMDGIKPYRLDFQTKGLSLTSYWKDEVNQVMRKMDKDVILSLASDEFTNLVDKDLGAIKVRFLDIVDGEEKQISVFNKQLRGKMLRYLVDKKASSLDDLPIELEGYRYSTEKSSSTCLVYIRLQPSG